MPGNAKELIVGISLSRSARTSNVTEFETASCSFLY